MTAIFIRFSAHGPQRREAVPVGNRYQPPRATLRRRADVSISDPGACTLRSCGLWSTTGQPSGGVPASGEYIHQLIRAYAARRTGTTCVAFTSSWKDRPAPGLGAELGATGRRPPHPRAYPELSVASARMAARRSAGGPARRGPFGAPAVDASPARRAGGDNPRSVLPVEPDADDASRSGVTTRPWWPHHARRADAVITSTQHGKAQIRRTPRCPRRSRLRLPTRRPELADARSRSPSAAGRMLPVHRHTRTEKEYRHAARGLRATPGPPRRRAATRARRPRHPRGRRMARPSGRCPARRARDPRRLRGG